MPATSRETTASPDRLWDVLVDVGRWSERIPTVESVEPVEPHSPPGDLRVGSAYVVRQPGLPAATYVVTECVPGERFTWVSRSRGLTSTATHVVTRHAHGARLEVAFHWSGPLARLAGLLGRRTARRYLAIEAASLTVAAEGGQ